MQGLDDHEDDDGCNHNGHRNKQLCRQQWPEVAAMAERQRQLLQTRGNSGGSQEDTVVVATEVATRQQKLQQTRGGGESGWGRQEVMTAAAYHIRYLMRSYGQDYHFPFLLLFLTIIC
jgi:hypothetical protein